MTFRGSPATPVAAPDPFLAEIARQPEIKKSTGSADLKPDAVFVEVPLHTPIQEARAIMERHDFSCWMAVPDGDRVCLHCTAYHRKRPDYMDRIVVKLYYENRRVVNAAVIVNYDAHRTDLGIGTLFAGPRS